MRRGNLAKKYDFMVEIVWKTGTKTTSDDTNILGLLAGTVDNLADFFALVHTGFAGAGSWSVVMMLWIGAFGRHNEEDGCF